MKFVYLALITVVFLGIVSAAPDHATMGPYKVDFDLNITENYNIVVQKSMTSETFTGIPYNIYKLQIVEPMGSDRYRIATIEIDNYQNDMIFDLNSIIGTPSGILKPSIYNRTIDNKEGLVAVTNVLGLANLFNFAYALGSHAVLFGESNYPWDEGTLQLLKTLHVEKVESG